VIVVEFERFGNEIHFIDVKQKEFTSSDKSLYLYKKGSSRGTNITPSSLITEVKKTFDIKFLKWFKDNKDDDFIRPFYNEIEENKDMILEKIVEVHKNLESKKNHLLTISIKENDEVKYIGNYSYFEDIFKKNASAKYYKLGSKEIKGDGECFLCGETKQVLGLVPSAIGFGFSNADKPGNLPDLSQMNQWKQIPICLNCALTLGAGKNFVDKYLSFSEFGLKYYAIPTFLDKKDNIINELFDFYLDSPEDKSYYNTIVSDEKEISELSEDLNNIIEFKFLYYETNNSAFNILSYVESIMPSWISNLYDAHLKVKSNVMFQEDMIKSLFGKNAEGDFINFYNKDRKYNHVKDYNWIFGFLRDFFPSSVANKYYIDLISSIFSNNKLNFSFILSHCMETIRQKFRQNNEYFMRTMVIESLMIFRFLNDLELINNYNTDTEDKEDYIMENNSNQFDKYLNELNTPDKKASFLLGVLTRKLTSIQYNELGSSPFTNKLWGLSLDKKKIQKLYPMVLGKLTEYDAGHYYIPLTEEISDNLIRTDNNWKLTRDETSFYFVLGYTLSKLYVSPKKGDNKEENPEKSVDN
jgi:CRISPR-associated protein Csh1